MQSWLQNLDLLIKSRTPLIWIKSKEEERLLRVLESVRERLNKTIEQTMSKSVSIEGIDDDW